MKVCLLFKIFVISAEGHARFVNLFVLLFVWIFTVYLLKLFCSATVPLCDTIALSRPRHIRLTSIDTSKWYWDVNSLYRKMTFPKFSAPVCSCIVSTRMFLIKICVCFACAYTYVRRALRLWFDQKSTEHAPRMSLLRLTICIYAYQGVTKRFRPSWLGRRFFYLKLADTIARYKGT